MNQKFNVGDLVRRVAGSHNDMNIGDVGLVEAVTAYGIVVTGYPGYIELRHSGSHDPDNFELADAVAPPAGLSMHLSTDPAVRKGSPITTGVLDYFPRAIAAVAQCSKAGNDQHHPGQPLYWEKDKSADHADCIARHLIDRHTTDTDGILHAAKLAWRALALLETMLEEKQNAV
jgi:hypothetical protein